MVSSIITGIFLQVLTDFNFIVLQTYINIADISYKKENVAVPCVNCIDNESPSFVEYIPHRLPHGNVTINEDPDFLVCCDCTDGCRDRSKCACQQLTGKLPTVDTQHHHLSCKLIIISASTYWMGSNRSIS